MKNVQQMIADLNNAIQDQDFTKSKIIIEVLEDILRKNIYKDESLVENNQAPLYMELNEQIKKETVKALLVIHKKDKELTVYLDDKRPTPKGFVRAFWPDDVSQYIENLDVTSLSLDHDLGDDERGTGNDVVCYVEEKVYFSDYIAPSIVVHSDNSSAKAKMMLGIKNIENKMKGR